MRRLGPQHLTGLPAQVRRPSYERSSLHQGIVHLGIGAFARAHLAAINEDTIEATGERRFGIVGVSLRSRETSEALVPQAGLYALALNDADAQGQPRQSLRVIGNLISLCVAADHGLGGGAEFFGLGVGRFHLSQRPDNRSGED